MVTVTSEGAAGGAAEGYRDSRVSNVGPWQGRTLEETPYSITVFSEELMENVQAVSADQIYRINPTMQQTRVQYENNQPTVSVRGFSFYSSYRDGVPDDQYGHITTVEDTERVEVFNGLSGFIYGVGNVGGLINYVTKRSPDERINSLTLSSRGHQAWYAHGDFGGKFDAQGRFGYRLNLARQGGNTAIRGQEIDREFYSLILDAKPSNDVYLQASAARMEFRVNGSQASWSATAATRPAASALRNNRSYGPSWTRRRYETDRHTLHARWDVNDALSLRATALSSDGRRNGAGSPVSNTFTADGRYTQSIGGVYAPGVNDLITYQDDARAAVYGDLKFNTGSLSHKLTVGYQYTNTKQDWYNRRGADRIDGGSFPIGDPGDYIARPVGANISRGDTVPRFRTRRLNFMLGDDIIINDRWSVLAGVSQASLRTLTYRDSAITPSVSVLFKPMPTLTTYLSYMESLEQGGTAADEYEGVEVVNKGQVFKPLKSRQFEVGAKYDWNGLLLSTSLYQIDKGLQYYDLRDRLRPVYVQDGRQVHKGLEFTAVGRLTRDLSVLGGFALLDPKVKKQQQNPLLEGKRPIHVARRMVKLRAEYDVPSVEGLSVSAGFNTTGASYADTMNTDRLSGYTVYDLGLRYETRVAQRPLTLRLDVTNLGNKHYWSSGTALGEPRTLAVSVNYKF